jgi:hypothetical protein
VVVVVLVILGFAIGVPLGVYGQWAGWGFGLGWWGRPTPARVKHQVPLVGALMKGGADWAITEATHRVRLDMEVRPGGGEPYEASAITFLPGTTDLTGQVIEARVSRTRRTRVHVRRGVSPAEDPSNGTY